MAKSPAKKETTAVADASAFEEFVSEHGSGFENVTAADIIIPRIGILQGLSPAVTRGDPLFDPEARVGDIYDLGMQIKLGEPLTVIVAHFAKQFIEWAPRSSGKGLVAIHNDPKILESCKRNERNQPITESGNLIRETMQFFCILPEHDYKRCFIPMSSTQLKKGKKLLSLALEQKLPSGAVAPLFFREYNLSTVPESNQEGNWIGWKIDMGGLVQERDDFVSLMGMIGEFRTGVTSGTMRADESHLEDEGEKGGEAF